MSSSSSARGAPAGVRLLAPLEPAWRAVLAPEALELLATLHRRFEGERRARLAERRARQARFDAGELPAFLEETRALREGTWRAAEIAPDLQDRRVEITGPAERKLIINALNSGARVFMADFEDATAPTWPNLISGQAALAEAVRRTLEHEDPRTRKRYRLGEELATLVVRPRGWHLPEAHVTVDGEPVAGALLDFALYFQHNARELVARGTGPYFYLPKLESRLEARLWNEVFLLAQDALGLPRGTIRATVLIETLPAAFEMDEILWELREHAAGLNCGRWDYIFSFIKTRRADPACVLPDRALVGMERHFLRSYSRLLVRTCHRRGLHAMGGMAAQIPLKDPALNALALERVRADKLREVKDGHDGTWVAHPGLVGPARAVFDEHMPGPNQIERPLEELVLSAEDLLAVPDGPRSEAGLRQNVSVAIRYLAAWLSGTGCVPLDGLMEDAATAEISRAQVWQWLRHGARLEDGRVVDRELVRRTIEEQMQRIRAEASAADADSRRTEEARALFEELATAPVLEDFLTLPAYHRSIDTWSTQCTKNA